jgi:hypothetical protein
MARTDLLQQISNTTTNFGTGNFTTNSFTPPDNSLLVVSVTIIENSGATTDPRPSLTITDSLGVHLTYVNQKDEVAAPTAFPTATRQYTAVVGTGASMTLTFGCGGRAIGFYAVSVSAETGYNTSTPVGAKGSLSQNGGFTGPPDPLSFNLSAAPAASSEVIAAWGIDKTTAGVLEGVGWTEIHDSMHNTDWGGMETEARTGSTSVAVSIQDARSGGGSLFNVAATAIEILMGGPSVTIQSGYTPLFLVINGRLIPKFHMAQPSLSTDGISVVDVTVTDSPNGVRLGTSSFVVAVDVVTSDLPNGVRAGVSTASVVTDTVMSDAPNGVRIGVSPSSTTIDMVLSDAPNAVRVSVSSATIAVDILTTDIPTGVRVGMSGGSVVADAGFSDAPTGIRIGTSPATVVYDSAISDAPTGVRLGTSPAAAGSVTTTADNPTGVRLGSSPGVVVVDVVVTDVPSGLRLPQSLATVLFGVVITDAPSGIRMGVSGATAGGAPVTVLDKPTGIRLGSSPGGVRVTYDPVDVKVVVSTSNATSVVGAQHVAVTITVPHVSN